MAKGIRLSEDLHVVNVLPPVDMTGGKKTQSVNMKNAARVSFLIQIGVSAAAPGAVTVVAGDAAAAVGADVGNGVAVAFDMYKQETAGAANDVLSVKAATAAAGFTPAATDGIFYVLEVEADGLPAGKPHVQLVMANGVNSVIASAAAVLSGCRYAGEASATVTV